MNKTKFWSGLGIATLILMSSGKKETTEELYAEQIKALEGRTTVSGDTISAADIDGKMLILNFWASYDATSRMNSYQLVTLANEYADAEFYNSKGLGVVSVSLDKYYSPMMKAIATDGTESFMHICDKRGTESEMAQSFDVNRPVNLLIDSEGKIVARDFHVGDIRKTLEMLAAN